MRLAPDNYPVTCAACEKGLEVIVRNQLKYFSAEGLLKVLDLTNGMRNGDIRE